MDRHQGRRARGIDGHAGATKPEGERHATGGGIQRRASCEIDVASRRVGDVDPPCIVGGSDADEYAGETSLELVGRYRGLFLKQAP